jgi:hypothetical protein
MKLYTYMQLFEIPAAKQIVPRWVAERDIVLWYGQTGSYKSFSVLDMLHSVATGRDWCGIPVEPHPTLYIASEGASGVPDRVRVWGEQRGLPDDARYVLDGVRFGDENNASIQELIDSCEAADFLPRLVAIDTLAASMLGGNENSSQDIGLIIGGAKVIRDAFDAAVIIIDHTGWDETREKGSSSKRQHCDVVIESKKIGETTAQLSQIKNRNSAPPPPITVKLSTVGASLLPDRIAADPSGLTEKELNALAALKNGPLKHGTWLEHSGTAKTTFNRWLPGFLSRELITFANDRYTITTKGLSCLSVPRSHASPTQSHGTESQHLVPRPHVYRHGTGTSGPLSRKNGTIESEAVDEKLAVAAYARAHALPPKGA